MLLDGNSAYPLSFCPYSETGIYIYYSFNAFGGMYYTYYHGYRKIGLHGVTIVMAVSLPWFRLHSLVSSPFLIGLVIGVFWPAQN